MTIRRATGADADTIAAVVRAAFAEHQGRTHPPMSAHDETAETVREKLRTQEILLALAGDTLVGCVTLKPEVERLSLFRLAVLPSHRRRGIGRALIAAVETRAVAFGLPRVRLGVRLSLTENRAWYERLGYAPVEYPSHPGFDAPTYVWMEKTL